MCHSVEPSSGYLGGQKQEAIMSNDWNELGRRPSMLGTLSPAIPQLPAFCLLVLLLVLVE